MQINASASEKYIFANQLRGIAAILVVMTHYFGTFFAEQALLAARTFSPDLQFKPSAWVHYFELPYQGPFGVSLFFLISGFVIPFSLAKARPLPFLLHRALRIFPTYAAALAVGTLAVWLSAHYWQQPFSYDAKVLGANALLVHNLLGMPSMDAVNWTLSIEVKFYLLAALLGAGFYRRGAAWLPGFAAVAAFATWRFTVTPGLPAQFVTLVMELNYVIYMVLGILFYQHVRGLISTPGLLLRALAILAAFSFTWSIGPQKDQFPWVTANYYAAFAVFTACYFLRSHFRPMRVLDFFADISYPLYCVHPLIGYCLLKVLMANGLPFGAAVLLTLPVTITVAWLLHKLVEDPTNEWGRRLSAALTRRRADPAAAPQEARRA